MAPALVMGQSLGADLCKRNELGHAFMIEWLGAEEVCDVRAEQHRFVLQMEPVLPQWVGAVPERGSVCERDGAGEPAGVEPVRVCGRRSGQLDGSPGIGEMPAGK